MSDGPRKRSEGDEGNPRGTGEAGCAFSEGGATYIAIEGPIGVGKTSLAKALAERLRARLILEPVQENPFLECFYADMRKYAFQTEIAFLLARYKQQQELLQSELFHTCTVADYIFRKNDIFARLTLTEEELLLFRRLEQMLAPRIPPVDFAIYLQADVDVLMSRIRRRRLAFEDRIPRDYLERVVEAYERFFFEFDACPLLIVNTNDVNFPEDRINVEELIGQLERVKSGTQYYVPTKHHDA